MNPPAQCIKQSPAARSLAASASPSPPLWFRSPWSFIALCSPSSPPQSSAAGCMQLPQTRRLEAEGDAPSHLGRTSPSAGAGRAQSFQGGASCALQRPVAASSAGRLPRPAAASPHRRLILPRGSSSLLSDSNALPLGIPAILNRAYFNLE